jgi:hypothetical protein
MNSDSAIFCFGEENMNSYEENEKRKDGAKIHFCAVFALCAKTAQDYLRKLRLAPSIKRKVLHCAATKATLLFCHCSARAKLFKKKTPNYPACRTNCMQDNIRAPSEGYPQPWIYYQSIFRCVEN